MSHGPVQYFVFAFTGTQVRGEVVPALKEVVAKGLIQIVDIVFVKKEADGEIVIMEINDLGDEVFNLFADVVDHTEGLLSDEDIQELASEIQPGNSAACLVFEHAWATQLASAIRNANGRLLKQGFVPQEMVETYLQEQSAAE